MKSLEDKLELDDSIINAFIYINIVTNSLEDKILGSDTFFVSSLLREKFLSHVWIDWASKMHIWNFNVWMLLIHLETPVRHSSLLLVVPKLRKFIYLDSFYRQLPATLIPHLCSFMNKFRTGFIRKSKNIPWSKWTLHIPDDVPRQGSGG